MSNSIFDFAPHELNHSAFWAWILDSLSNERSEDPKNKTRISIAHKFLEKAGITDSEIKIVSVKHQSSPEIHKTSERSIYDIEVNIKEKTGENITLVIETKVNARAGSNQLKKYMDSIGDSIQDGGKGYLVLLDIQGLSALADDEISELLKTAKEKHTTFQIFTPADIIQIIKDQEEIDHKYDGYIVESYLDWIEKNKDFWDYVCKRTVYEIGKNANNKNVYIPQRHKSWGWKLESKKIMIGEVGLIFEKDPNKASQSTINIECWFGEDYNQIREIFENREIARENFRKLENNGWKIRPNLYFCVTISKRHYAKQISSCMWKKYFDKVYDPTDIKSIKYYPDKIKEKFYNLEKSGAIENINETDGRDLDDDTRKIMHMITLKRSIGAIYSYTTHDLLSPKNLKKLDKIVAEKIDEALGDLPDKS